LVMPSNAGLYWKILQCSTEINLIAGVFLWLMNKN
jgi:hypothetical protein